MADIKSGGPAFPLENPRYLENGDLFKQFPGMTLRQWYAGQALIGMAPRSTRHDEAAKEAFAFADAMVSFEAAEGSSDG